MTTKELLDVPGYEGKSIVIKKLGYGSLTQMRSKILRASGKNAEDISATIDVGLYQKWLVIYGVVSAPFWDGAPTIDARVVAFDNDAVSAEAGEYLFRELQTFNNFENLLDQKKE